MLCTFESLVPGTNRLACGVELIAYGVAIILCVCVCACVHKLNEDEIMTRLGQEVKSSARNFGQLIRVTTLMKLRVYSHFTVPAAKQSADSPIVTFELSMLYHVPR